MSHSGHRHTPESRARISEGHAARLAPSVQCPKWVPLSLKREFFERAALYGEEAAASHIRALKREMEK